MTAPRNTDLPTRLVSAIVMLAIAGLAFWLGGPALDGFIAIITAAAFVEFVLLIRRISARPLSRVAALLGGAVYMGYAATVLILLPEAYVVMLVGAVVATDTGAFFTGRSLGGPKIAPSISPSKTWSGLLGGMLLSALWMVLALGTLRYGMAGMDPASQNPVSSYLSQETGIGALVGAALAVAAQAGDFLESWIKRKAAVKDSSRLIPGHGGIFDRVDGMLPVAVLAGLALAWPI